MVPRSAGLMTPYVVLRHDEGTGWRPVTQPLDYAAVERRFRQLRNHRPGVAHVVRDVEVALSMCEEGS